MFRFRNRIKARKSTNRIACEDGSEVPLFMGEPEDGEKAKKPRKPYERPTITKLMPERAKLKLLGHASEGHQGGAKRLLETRDSKAKKKSA